MAKITTFVGYKSDKPKPSKAVDPQLVSVRDGIVVKCPKFNGTCTWVVHPANSHAPSKNMGLLMVYLPPHVGGRAALQNSERTYLILEGEGRVNFDGGQRDVKSGDFIYAPPGCELAIENIGNDMLVLIVATAEPNRTDDLAAAAGFTGYETDNSPLEFAASHAIAPSIVSVREGIPVKYPSCDGLGIRVVHPVNPAAQAKEMGLVVVYLPPGADIKMGSHETEENYVILGGRGRMKFSNFERKVKRGDIIHLPSWCVHGLRNTSNKPCVALVATAPPNP